LQRSDRQQIFAVCVNSSFVLLAKSFVKNSSVKVASTVGFPLGAASTYAKAIETEKP